MLPTTSTNRVLKVCTPTRTVRTPTRTVRTPTQTVRTPTSTTRTPNFFDEMIIKLKKQHSLEYAVKIELNKLKFQKKLHDEIYGIILRKELDPYNLNHICGTLLHTTAMYGCVAICEFLLKKGSLLNVQNTDGYNALHIAVIFKQVDIIQLFMKHISSNHSDRQEVLEQKDIIFRKTALDWAKQEGHGIEKYFE